MSRKHYSIRWDERNVKPQCVACNVYRYGEQYKFSKKLGEDLSDELYLLSKNIIKYSTQDILDMIDYYSKKLKTFL